MRRTSRSPLASPLVAAGTALVLAAVMAACGDSTAPTTAALSDAQVAADVAATSGDAVANVVAGFSSDAGAAGIGGGAATGCPYDAASHTHLCAGTTERGLAVTRSYQYRDASGTPMQSYDAATTASIFFTGSADGSVSGTTDNGATWSAAIHRSGQRTVTGLAGDETQRVWNGTSTTHDTSDYAGTGGTRHYAGSATETSKDVVVKLPRSTFPYPASGTITRDVSFTLTVTGARNSTRTVTRTTVATFNGTASVPLVVNGTVSCTLNLDTGKVSGCTR